MGPRRRKGTFRGGRRRGEQRQAEASSSLLVPFISGKRGARSALRDVISPLWSSGARRRLNAFFLRTFSFPMTAEEARG